MLGVATSFLSKNKTRSVNEQWEPSDFRHDFDGTVSAIGGKADIEI